MEAFGRRLEAAEPTPEVACGAHYDLTTIHPFADGNGRTARLLMNLQLIRGGYPPVAVRPEDRARYLASLEASQLADDQTTFTTFMYGRLDATLADYLGLLRETVVTDRP